MAIRPEFKEKINDFTNIDKIKQDIKKDRAERVWNQIFKPDLNLGKLGILQIWKQKYLYPYGNIMPLNQFEQ